MSIRVTYIISDIDKALAFEWIADFLNKEKINLSFILINSENSYLKKYLENNNFSTFTINCTTKMQMLLAVWKCFLLLKKIKPDVVHCHLIRANLIGLTAAKLAGVKSRIYTRHHSNYHHIYFPKAVKIDKLINLLSTEIVAISRVVKDVLVDLEKVHENKIHLIYHGFNLEDFNNSLISSIDFLSQKYNPQKKSPVIGIISRQTEWKGIQFIIPAFQVFLKKYPDALLILANAAGDYKLEINNLLDLLPKENYIEVEFENDIFSLYQLFDIYTHVPISKSAEAFGQTYVEALASGTPSVFTLSGIANEFIIDKQNALVVPYKNSAAIYCSWNELIDEKEIRDRLIINGRNDVAQKFQLNQMITKLEELYNE
ncbi:MAG: glycosyltransferase family 4 protein [Bacteroidia bacterium]|nr:glycosyltransferase family 4 protein [Bacteroidia bacterium]